MLYFWDYPAQLSIRVLERFDMSSQAAGNLRDFNAGGSCLYVPAGWTEESLNTYLSNEGTEFTMQGDATVCAETVEEVFKKYRQLGFSGMSDFDVHLDSEVEAWVSPVVVFRKKEYEHVQRCMEEFKSKCEEHGCSVSNDVLIKLPDSGIYSEVYKNIELLAIKDGQVVAAFLVGDANYFCNVYERFNLDDYVSAQRFIIGQLRASLPTLKYVFMLSIEDPVTYFKAETTEMLRREYPLPVGRIVRHVLAEERFGEDDFRNHYWYVYNHARDSVTEYKEFPLNILFEN